MALTRTLKALDLGTVQQTIGEAFERESLAALSQRKLNALAMPLAYIDRHQRYRFANKAFLDWIGRRPDEVFLIEGHTDAVGSEIDNLTLSDRRAEEVAIILTETFNVPPENLVTQGYGEDFLKIPTLQAERANRRVAVRRITPLMARD